jgi:hypothetical protein
VVTSATPGLRSFCNSQWNFALALVARALQVPKQVLIRFPVAVSEEILGLGVLSALVDCAGEAGTDFHRAGFVLLAIGCSKEAVGCDEEIKREFFLHLSTQSPVFRGIRFYIVHGKMILGKDSPWQ